MSKKARFGALFQKATAALKDEKVQSQIKSGIQKAANTAQGKKILNKISQSKIGKTILSKLNLNFTQEEWEEEHQQGTVEANSQELNEIAINVKTASLNGANLNKVCFICCNTYQNPEYSLGVGPMNDAITVASYMKDVGFAVYYAHNPKSNEYLKYFREFYSKTTGYLVVYYTGHGASVKDTNGDEQDGFDEALVFDDDFVVDDELAEVLGKTGKPESSTVLLLNDCCHSGSIYDLQNGTYQGMKMPEKIISCSAANDKETAKQTTVGSKDQGIFTFYFFKFLTQNPNFTPKQMNEQIKPYLSKFDQNFVAYSTTPVLLDKPLFQ